MIAIHQGGFYSGDPLSKICGFKQDLGLAKHKTLQLKPEKIQIDELFYQPEKLQTEFLLEVLSKIIAEEINTTLKNEYMTCLDPALLSCCLNNSREKSRL